MTFVSRAGGRQPETNYDESKVPDYRLPELLVGEDGTDIETAVQWRRTRRPEILQLFQEHVYGRPPAARCDVQFDVTEQSDRALAGTARRKQIDISCRRNGRSQTFKLLIYLPAASERPVPLFLGLNFRGNQTIADDSRLGKAALWAGASDERFALVVSNNSGCGGAALSRRRFGETVRHINDAFPHWFCHNFRNYNGREDDLPVDQHMLIGLIAPRPVYIASASDDLWADPRGEFLAALHAEPAYRLLGRQGLGRESIPGVDRSIGQSIGYHLRSGGHDVTGSDWRWFLDFADRHLTR